MLGSSENRSGRRICPSASKWFRYKSHGKWKNFSGGQKQRLTITRALIAKPALLILDDSLSALDYQTDLDLRKALQTYLGSTVIIISQRVRSIQEAHHILVMDQGKIAAQGTHEELLAQSAEYQEIVASQEEE